MAVTKLNKYCEEAMHYVDKSKEVIKKYPAAGFVIGMGLYPINLALESIAQGVFRFSGLDYVRMSHIVERSWTNITHLYLDTEVEIARSVFRPIGIQLFYGEFIQNYLLDKQLSKLLKRVAPSYADFPKTTHGKIFRVAAAGFLDALSVYLDYARSTSIHTEGWINRVQTIHPIFSTSTCIAQAMNVFLGTCLSGASREITGSNLPGIGFHWIQSV